MVPPDDDSKEAVPGCEVEVETRTIRFRGCKDHKAMISAVQERVALVTRQLAGHSGLTNKERRRLSNEGNILRRWLDPFPGVTRTKDAAWLFPEARTPEQRRRMLNKARNPMPKRRKATKRRAREARRWHREQPPPLGLGTLQTRPDCNRPVISLEDLERLMRLRES